MNDGMKIILERMKTHPEEFQPDYSNLRTQGKNKWEVLIDKYEKNLNPEDINAFAEAFDAMRQEQFTAQVMKELMGSKEDEEDFNPFTTVPIKKDGSRVEYKWVAVKDEPK